ncbi:MAG: thioredoxin domain-containing protein [Thermoplasmatota archaeon]
MTVEFWGEAGDVACDEARAFLKLHGFRPDRLMDVNGGRPSPTDVARLATLAGGLAHLVPSQPEADVADVAAHPEWLRLPILATPKGALVGFRERAWARFLGVA